MNGMMKIPKSLGEKVKNNMESMFMADLQVNRVGAGSSRRGSVLVRAVARAGPVRDLAAGWRRGAGKVLR